MAATVVTDPAKPTSVAAVLSRHGLRREVDRPRRCRPAPRRSAGSRRIVAQMPFGQPHASDIDRSRGLDGTPTHHEFGRAAADVDDKVGLFNSLDVEQFASSARERECSFLIARDHLGINSQCLPHAVDKRVAVRHVARCAGGHEPHSLDALRHGSARRSRGTPRRCAPMHRRQSAACGRLLAPGARCSSRGRRRPACRVTRQHRRSAIATSSSRSRSRQPES